MFIFMKDIYHKIGPFIGISIVVFFCYLMFKPYLMSIASAMVVAYLFFPLYTLIEKKTTNKSMASVLTIIIIFLIVILPMAVIVTKLISELPGLYSGFVAAAQSDNTVILEKISADFGIELNVGKVLGGFIVTILNVLQEFIATIPAKIVNIVIGVFFLFYFFRDGDRFGNFLIHYLPFGVKNSKILIEEVKKTADAVIYGQIITATVQSIVALLGFWVIGIRSPLFFAVLLFFFSVIPMVGPIFVYLPLGLYMIFHPTQANLWQGVTVLIFGFGIISSIDNIIKPIVISDKMKLHTAAVLISMISGITLFGVLGLVIGPILLTLFVTLFNLYELRTEMIDSEE